MTKYISGPTEIVRMKSAKYDKDIYLVSDIHFSLSGICKTKRNTEEFHLYIDKIFKDNPDKTFDFFIEERFLPENKNRRIALCYLNKTISYFTDKGCFSIKTEDIKKCRIEYLNVRFHLGDLRGNKIHKIDENFKFFIFMDFINHRYEPKQYIYRNIKHIRKFLLHLKYKKNLNKFYKNLWKTEIIKTQYKKIKDKYLKKHIKKYFNEHWVETLSVREDFLKQIKKNMSDDDAYELFISDDLKYAITKIGSIVMDIYLILRLFKDFHNNPSKNIIIHAGGGHIGRYIRLLRTLDFKLIEEAKIKKKRCLDISKMNEFFS